MFACFLDYQGVLGNIVCCSDYGDEIRLTTQYASSRHKEAPYREVRGLNNGCSGWDRTSDQVINSHLLYR
jgi:hypothetical protein